TLRRQVALLKLDGSGGDLQRRRSLQVERRNARRPRRNVLRGQVQPTETAAIMFELSESRQHLLGTKRYVVSTRLTHRPTNRISLPGTCISDKSFHRWNQANALALRNLEGKGVAAFPTGILGLSGNSRQCWESGSEYVFRGRTRIALCDPSRRT